MCVCVTFVFRGQSFGRHGGLRLRWSYSELELSSLMETTVVVVEVAGVEALVRWLPSEYQHCVNNTNTSVFRTDSINIT